MGNQSLKCLLLVLLQSAAATAATLALPTGVTPYQQLITSQGETNASPQDTRVSLFPAVLFFSLDVGDIGSVVIKAKNKTRLPTMAVDYSPVTRTRFVAVVPNVVRAL